MSDVWLLATPVLMLGVLAIVRFVGCVSIPEFHAPEPPSNLIAVAGNQEIALRWTPPEILEAGYLLKRGTATGVYSNTQQIDISQTTTIDGPLPNGVRQFYVLVHFDVDGAESAPSNEASAIPGLGLVVKKTLGTPRNNFTGWVGMLIRIAGTPLTVVGLGRIFVAGSSGQHAMKIVDATTNVDLPNAATVVDLSPPNLVDGRFVYGALQTPVVLSANVEYYVVSEEVAGGEQWYDLDTVVETPTAVAVVESAVFGDGVSSYTRAGTQTPLGTQTFGPVDVLS